MIDAVDEIGSLPLGAELAERRAAIQPLIERCQTCCVLPRLAEMTCAPCSLDDRRLCRRRLGDLIGELLGCLLDHFEVEDRLMRGLPQTLETMRHVALHHEAHADISRVFSHLTHHLNDGEPRWVAVELQAVVDSWLGPHAERHDVPLLRRLVDRIDSELNRATDDDSAEPGPR